MRLKIKLGPLRGFLNLMMGGSFTFLLFAILGDGDVNVKKKGIKLTILECID